ncbi:MAG: hypothetical protein V4662_02565 [Verrucomicrobiota bacterium]
MPRRKDPWKEAAKRQAQEAEIEKDTIYYLDFTPKDGRPTGRSTLLNDAWCVRLAENPKGDPTIIEEALRTFAERHSVTSWSEVASRYEVNSFWYP